MKSDKKLRQIRKTVGGIVILNTFNRTRFYCYRCNVECTHNYQVTGSEYDKNGFRKFIMLCTECYSELDNFTSIEKSVYCKSIEKHVE